MWKKLGATHVIVLADTADDGLACCASGATMWLPRDCPPRLIVHAVTAVDSGGASTAGILELIVRRGAQRRYDLLRRKTIGLPVVVTWDRRGQERRVAAIDVASGERRRLERRQSPPYTWEVADFVLIERGRGKEP
jgi:DNA-binding NarL/FixJ family response regulator